MQSPLVAPTSEDFAIVEYLLQMQLDAPQFKIEELRDISSRHQVNNFNNYVKKMKNANVVDAFVLLKSIQQPLSDIAGHGLRLPVNSGFKFQLDHLELPEEQDKYEVLHLIIALGTVMDYQSYDSELNETEYIKAVPTIENLKGCDSLRVSADNTFYIFNQAQIKTAHLVIFKGGDNLSHAPHTINTCAVCGQANATLFCESDSIKLCPECDQKIHSSNPLFQNHVRIPLREGLPKIQACHFHPEQRAQYYCTKCHYCVCAECKINGNHAHGDNAKHKLISLSQAYNDAHAVVNATNVTYVTRQKVIEEAITAADERLDEICENAIAVEKEIMRLAEAAIASMKQQAHDRATVVKAAKIELERKLGELKKQQEYLHIHDENSEPADFLKYYTAAKELEQEMQIGRDLPLPLDVYGDLIVYGKLEVSPPRPINPDETITHTVDEANLAGFAVSRGVKRDETESTVTDTYTVTQTTTDSQQIIERNPRFSRLSKVAQRKLEKLKENGQDLTFLPFKGSEIILDDEDKRTLYLTLPFKGIPETHLMYSTNRDGRSIIKMHKLIDEKGITLIVVRANGYVFGGFAAAKWNSNGVPFGDQSSCFLFSLTNDAFIPAHGQSEDPCKLFATEDSITFGREDLRIAGNFDDCSSHLENSYGVGLVYGGTKAGTFLAGQPNFVAEVVEVWGFFANE